MLFHRFLLGASSFQAGIFHVTTPQFQGKQILFSQSYHPKITKNPPQTKKNKEKSVLPTNLVGGFNPFEKYESKWESSPNRDENKKYLKPPPSISFALKNYTQKGTRAVNTYLITHLPHLQGKVHRAALQIRDCNILCLN